MRARLVRSHHFLVSLLRTRAARIIYDMQEWSPQKRMNQVTILRSEQPVW